LGTNTLWEKKIKEYFTEEERKFEKNRKRIRHPNAFEANRDNEVGPRRYVFFDDNELQIWGLKNRSTEEANLSEVMTDGSPA